MTSQPAKWTRRQFAQTLAASAAASSLPNMALTSPIPAKKGFEFIGSADNTIHVFEGSGSDWSPLQVLPAASPAHLALHPTLPVLYAVHDVTLWDNLPRGAVSAYSIAPTGHLTLLHTQPLSLSATNPRHAAVAPDGTSFAVTAPAAGIFNILTIAVNGTLQPPAIIHKRLTLNTAETHSIFFLRDSKTLLTTDSKHRSLKSFTIQGDFLIPSAVEPGRAFPTRPLMSSRIIPGVDSPISFLLRPA